MNNPNITAVENMHKLMLEALRHREQDIFRYLAILGPALSGFIWLFHKSDKRSGEVFIIGTVIILFLLLLGAVYSVALGYNYRYITFQLAKLEARLHIRDYILAGWPKSEDDFLKRYKPLCSIPWCTPPEIIKVFWLAFLIGGGGITVAAYFFQTEAPVKSIVLPFGAACCMIGLLSPWHYGKKLCKGCEEEPEGWELDRNKSQE